MADLSSETFHPKTVWKTPGSTHLRCSSGAEIYIAGGGQLEVAGNITAASGGQIIAASGSSMVVQSGGSINVESGGVVNVESGGDISLASGGQINVVSGSSLVIATGGALNVESGGDITLESGGQLNAASGSSIVAKSGGSINVESGGSLVVESGGKFRHEHATTSAKQSTTLDPYGTYALSTTGVYEINPVKGSVCTIHIHTTAKIMFKGASEVDNVKFPTSKMKVIKAWCTTEDGIRYGPAFAIKGFSSNRAYIYRMSHSSDNNDSILTIATSTTT